MIDEGDAARRRRGLRQRPRHLPAGHLRLHERPAGLQRDRHGPGRGLQRHGRQLRRRHRQRHLPADRPVLPLPGRSPRPRSTRRAASARAGTWSAAARWASCARAACCPSAEICDGKDNNCDGMTDTAGKCPSGFGCRDGQCTLQCMGGEFPCPPGYKCVDQFCIPQRCANVTCAAGRELRRDDRRLRRPVRGRHLRLARRSACAGAASTATIRSLACTAPEICVGGVCKTDKCLGKSCPDEHVLLGRHLHRPLRPRQVRQGRALRRRHLPARRLRRRHLHARASSATRRRARARPTAARRTQCGAGMTCVSMTNTCKVDPCSTIQCPSDCWHCGVDQGRHRHLPPQRQTASRSRPRSARRAAAAAAAARPPADRAPPAGSGAPGPGRVFARRRRRRRPDQPSRAPAASREGRRAPLGRSRPSPRGGAATALPGSRFQYPSAPRDRRSRSQTVCRRASTPARCCPPSWRPGWPTTARRPTAPSRSSAGCTARRSTAPDEMTNVPPALRAALERDHPLTPLAQERGADRARRHPQAPLPHPRRARNRIGADPRRRRGPRTS